MPSGNRKQTVPKEADFRGYLGQIRGEYEKRGGLKKTAVLVPPWMKNYYLKVEDDFDNYADDIRVMARKAIIKDFSMKKNCGIVKAEEMLVELERLHPEMVRKVIDDAVQSLFLAKVKPILLSGELAWTGRLITNPIELGQWLRGTTKVKKNTYSSWDGRFGLFGADKYHTHFIRFQGEWGTGKSSGMTLCMEDGAYYYGDWIRSNVPIYPYELGGKVINAQPFDSFSKLFINDPPGSSILNASLAGVWVAIGIDEQGTGMEAYSQSTMTTLYEELYWLLRHLKMKYYSTGVKDLPPVIQDNYVTHKILTYSRDSPSGKRDSELQPIKEFKWKVQRQIQGEAYHEQTIVYGIPKPDQKPSFNNKLEMALGMSMDISIKQLTQVVNMNASPEAVVEEAHIYVKCLTDPKFGTEYLGILDEDGRPVDVKDSDRMVVARDALNKFRTLYAKNAAKRKNVVINEGGYATNCWYRCEDCGNRWLFRGKGMPICSRKDCRKTHVIPLSVDELDEEEFKILQSVMKQMN